jgi:hypothetical protein
MSKNCLEISSRQYYKTNKLYTNWKYVKVLQYRLEAANISIPSIIAKENPLVLSQ